MTWCEPQIVKFNDKIKLNSGGSNASKALYSALRSFVRRMTNYG